MTEPARVTQEGRGAVHKAYEALRDLLADGAYPSGAHLREESLAAELGVSRTPVREAVRQLAAEGWLELVRNQGAFVARWAREDVEEVLDLRAVLEARAARHAAVRATPKQIKELDQICREALALLPCTEPGAAEAVARCNSRFHRLVVEASGQRRTAAILANLVDLPITRTYFRRLTPQDMERSLREHRTLVEAIAARDAAWAEALMRAHVHGGKSLFIQRVEAVARAGDAPVETSAEKI